MSDNSNNKETDNQEKAQAAEAKPDATEAKEVEVNKEDELANKHDPVQIFLLHFSYVLFLSFWRPCMLSPR